MHPWSVVAFVWPTYAVAYPQLASQTSSCVLDYTSILPKTIEVSISAEYGEFKGTIGSGSSATVSAYRRYTDNKTVAIKQYRLPSCTTDETQEVKLEYHLGAMVSNISSMTPTLDLLFDLSACQWYLVTEYIPHSLMDLRLTLSLEELVDIILSLEVGIHAMHNLGISHGDIKLENVLLISNHKPKLIDFGSATFHRCRVDALEAETNVAPGDYGTPAYLPPEVFTSLEYDRAKADLWALGVLAYVLFAGRMPWKLASLRDSRWREVLGIDVADSHWCVAPKSIVTHAICTSEMAQVVGEVPETIRDTIARWLEIDPGYRSYSS
ncbi:kinase-like protein [Aureobasidium pullulans]|uniref:Kinase-like protein n=1 Tax=Aureobasidium pullulans TaxID=5580 RepID=A0A4T0AUQ6_AURPU|nr:kinase-like protein [Aureobasidium pullulans]TIA25199.1 kinase-like protein [Aureobasidium pullulans]